MSHKSSPAKNRREELADATLLEEALEYRFQQRHLLLQALTHRSYGAEHNERLEFLGDSVLGCVISTLLYQRFPQAPEGALTRWRSTLVCRPSLSTIARALNIGPHLRMGDGESKSGGSQRSSLLTDSLEAILGAIYLDGGYEAVSQVIQRIYKTPLVNLDPDQPAKDPKTRLQEHLQSLHQPLPRYEVINVTGASHAQEFHVRCVVSAMDLIGEGKGETRRTAEQKAAEAVWKLLVKP